MEILPSARKGRQRFFATGWKRDFQVCHLLSELTSKLVHGQLDGRICVILWKHMILRFFEWSVASFRLLLIYKGGLFPFSAFFSSSTPMHPFRSIYWFDDQTFLWLQQAALLVLSGLKSATRLSLYEIKRDL